MTCGGCDKPYLKIGIFCFYLAHKKEKIILLHDFCGKTVGAEPKLAMLL